MIQRERKSRISVVHCKPTMEGMCDESRSRTSHHLPSCLETTHTLVKPEYVTLKIPARSHTGGHCRVTVGDTGLQPFP